MEAFNAMKAKKEYLFLIGILLIGLLTIFPYGAYLDQKSEQRILFGNIEEYLLHLPGETPGLVQELADWGTTRISLDEDRDHGMAVYYPAFVVWYLNKISPYAGSVFWHIYTFLLVFWGMCSLYFLGRELYGSRGTAMLTVLLFFLTPRMFAESHYNNKDMVLLSFCFTLFYLAWKLMRETSWKYVLLFAFVGALAFNMKLIGAWIFGALGLYAALYLAAGKRFDRKVFIKMLVCIGAWAGLYILLTPACWADFTGFFRYIFYYATSYDLWHDYILFGGGMIHKDYTGIPRKYLPVMISLTIPVGILFMTAGGVFAALGKWMRQKEDRLTSRSCFVLVTTAAGLVPLAYAALSGTPVYNGWRHFYFVYASMIVAAGFFLAWTGEKCEKRPGVQRAAAGVIAAYLLFLAAGIAVNYPQEHSYYNILAGSDVVNRYELDYWDMSIKQAYEAVSRDAGDRQVSVGALNNPTMWGLDMQRLALPERQREQLAVAEEWQQADYVIVNTTYAVMYSSDLYETVKAGYSLVAEFSSYGNIICEVWKR